jgi:hypothetical protein
MDRFLAEALGGELGRGDGAGRQDDMDVAAADFADQRDDGVGFTDACGMEPDERALRPVGARLYGLQWAIEGF